MNVLFVFDHRYGLTSTAAQMLSPLGLEIRSLREDDEFFQPSKTDILVMLQKASKLEYVVSSMLLGKPRIHPFQLFPFLFKGFS